MKINKIIPISFLIIGLFACSEDRESHKVVKGDLVESVYSSVVIEPSYVYNVTSSVSGYLDIIPVEIGDTVQPGDTLFLISDIQSHNSAENALLNYEAAKMNLQGNQSLLEDARLELDNLKLKLRNDSTSHERNKKLYTRSLITKVELEQSELNFEASRNAVRSAENRLKRLNSDLRRNLKQARNNYESTFSRYQDGIIQSRMNGVVYDIRKEAGEFTTMQEPIAIIGSTQDFVINMLIDEVDINRVKLGQEIILSLEAFPDKTFKGSVSRISPKMDTRTQSFEVEGVFNDRDEDLFMGLTGEANIIIQEKKNSIVIPREYLIDGKFVESEKGKIEVETGAKSLSHVEIKSGLKAGDLIYKPE